MIFFIVNTYTIPTVTFTHLDTTEIVLSISEILVYRTPLYIKNRWVSEILVYHTPLYIKNRCVSEILVYRIHYITVYRTPQYIADPGVSKILVY